MSSGLSNPRNQTLTVISTVMLLFTYPRLNIHPIRPIHTYPYLSYPYCGFPCVIRHRLINEEQSCFQLVVRCLLGLLDSVSNLLSIALQFQVETVLKTTGRMFWKCSLWPGRTESDTIYIYYDYVYFPISMHVPIPDSVSSGSSLSCLDMATKRHAYVNDDSLQPLILQ